jgi:hypothetical protein
MTQMTIIEPDTDAQDTSRGNGTDEHDGNPMMHVADFARVQAIAAV